MLIGKVNSPNSEIAGVDLCDFEFFKVNQGICVVQYIFYILLRSQDENRIPKLDTLRNSFQSLSYKNRLDRTNTDALFL